LEFCDVYVIVQSAASNNTFFRSRLVSNHMCGNTYGVYGNIIQDAYSAFRYMSGCEWRLL